MRFSSVRNPSRLRGRGRENPRKKKNLNYSSAGNVSGGPHISVIRSVPAAYLSSVICYLSSPRPTVYSRLRLPKNALY